MRQRNIVLLSDGTGNSAAKLNKTNVWRLYRALDLSGDHQIAFYDDGVGTSGFRPLRLLGGIFGWGLSRNVRDLYLQLCEHYRHVDEGEKAVDHIYIFGFSRGAFTARTLAGLIAKCGVLDKGSDEAIPLSRFKWRSREATLDTDEGMKAGVDLAYRSYRYGYSARLTEIWRRVTELFHRETPKAEVVKSRYAREVKITFVGVWDTVAAIGLPIEELSILVDRVVYPHRFTEQNLSSHVQRACHALAIDDQRHSFHPVLWNEQGEDDPDRIKQVWFPGMHSDVGGGYGDDGLAHVPLKWMVDQVKRRWNSSAGLDFQKDALAQIESRANSTAKMHDSRSGLSVYYRYKPRDIDRLSKCPDDEAPVMIDSPKLHHSLFDRIAAGTDGYAPTGIPTDYRLVDATGAVVDGPEDEDQRIHRCGLLDRSKSHIFWQRIQYFLFLFVTLGFFAFPYVYPPVPNGGPEGDVATKLGGFFSTLDWLVPDVINYWLDAWMEAWPAFLILAAIYLGLSKWAGCVRTNTLRLSEIAWRHVRPPQKKKLEALSPFLFERIATYLRKSPPAQHYYQLISKKALPIASLIMALFVVVGIAYRMFIHLPAAEAGICKPASEEQRYHFEQEIAFKTSDPCLSTGLMLQAGQSYEINIDTDGNWKDASIPASPGGFDSWLDRFRPIFLPALPAKRVLTYPLFTMVAEISGAPGEIYPLRETITIKPTTTGELRLYVNDAVDSFGEWDHFYKNNKGKATITVTSK